MEDKHIIWNPALKLVDYISAVKAVLDTSPSVTMFEDKTAAWPTFISRICWEYGISPIWLLVSFEREQGLLTKPTSNVNPWAWEAAVGLVGQDAPGSASPLFLGFPNQIWRGARQTAWLAGIGPQELFGGLNTSLRPSSTRWTGISINVPTYDAGHAQHGSYVCKSMAEYLQIAWTPHPEVLASNDLIYRHFLAKMFDPLLPS